MCCSYLSTQKNPSDAVGDVWKFMKKVGKNEFLFIS